MQILNISHCLSLVVYPYAFLKPEVLFCTVCVCVCVCVCVFCFAFGCALWVLVPPTRNHAQLCLLQWKLGILTTGLPDNSLKPEVLRELENKKNQQFYVFI